MVSKGKSIGLLLGIGLTLWIGQVRLIGAPMGTAFTYQGRFNDNGSPATGAYDFEFKLYDASAAGSQVGSTLNKEDLSVNDGYFTTTLDYGSGIFAGDARWLQIAVRPGASTGAYTTLTPRHELTPTPYTLCTGEVTIVDGGTIAAGNAKILFDDTDDRIELGDSATAVSTVLLGQTTDMIFQGYGGYREIHNSHNSGAIRIYATDALGTSPTGAAIQFFGNNESQFNGQAYIDSGAHDSAAVIFRTAPTSGTIIERMRITSGGNVGIGTTDPGTARLFVNGAAPGVAPNIITNGDVVFGAGAGVFFGWHSYAAGDYIMPSGGVGTQGFFTTGAERMRITNNGNIGVGTAAPTQKLDVNGNIYCSGTYEGSDANLKTDIQPLSGVLDKLSGVRAVSFRWNEEAKALGTVADGRRIGVLAQELEQVFPEMVSTPTPIAVDELLKGYPQKSLTPEVRERLQRDAERTQYKAVSYSQLTVVLLEAVKELQAQNRSLEERIQVLENGGQ